MNSEVKLLNQIYQNAKMGESSISSILSGIKNTSSYQSQIRHSMENQRHEYAKFSRQAARKLHLLQEVPQKANAVTRFSSQMGIRLNLMKNSRPSHLAEMMIQGSTMGIIDATGSLRHSSQISPETKKLAQNLIRFEERNVAEFKKYL